MQSRSKEKHKTKGDGFYHKKEDKPNVRGQVEKPHTRRKSDEDLDEELDLLKLGAPNVKPNSAKGSKVPGKQSKPRAAVASLKQGEIGREKKGSSSRERDTDGAEGDTSDEDHENERRESTELEDGPQQGVRQVTLAMTRSGAINTLSSRFLRDSDEAVQARKARAHIPFEKRPIVPRIYSHLQFPVRQDWSQVKSAEELEKMENDYFAHWLDETYQGRKVDHLSPFEHNLEVWRQLWRVLEKSDIIVLTADIRDPLLHIPVAFHQHVTRTFKLPMLIVLTKCDLVSDEHASKWKQFLETTLCEDGMTEVILNSGKCQSTHGIGGYSARRKILHTRATKAQIAEMHRQSRHVLDTAMDFAKMYKPDLQVVAIGIVGQPNTGKSSLVNAILGRHAVSVSRTCGHTKHWQTQNIKNEQDEVIATIIDSPGLIFPMVVDEETQLDNVSPRAWYECSGLYPIAQIRETYSAIRFVGERLDLPRMYNLKLNTDDYGDEWSPYAFLGSLADKRGYTLQMGGGAPDIHRAGLETINDICDGIVLLCFPPPDVNEWRSRVREEN